MTERLAIAGGRPACEGIEFRTWPETTAQDEEYVLASLRQDKHAWGPNCVALQEEFAAWNGSRFCAATNSGTAALHMAIAACGIGPGDEVICPTLSWTSSATCILHHNAIPVFVDVDWRTMLIDPARIEAAITPRTKAILPVHFWGVPCDMDPVMEIAARHSLFVIEDACQAHGALYKGRKVGTIGHCAAFSLNQNKNFSAGEGGLFVTDDEHLFTSARALMSFGEMRAPEEHRDYHSYGMGWMYRTSDLPAAYARSALSRIDQTNAAARANFERLTAGLSDIPGLLPSFDTPEQRGNCYQYIILLDWPSMQQRHPEHPKLVEGRRDAGVRRRTRDAIAAALQAEGVQAQLPRWILPAHTVFQAKNGYGRGCPWDCSHAARDVDYDLSQWPVTLDVVDSYFALAINQHRPPNGPEQIDALIAGIRKVFSHLDQIPVDQ